MTESIKIKYIAPLRGARGQSEDGLPYLGLENIESGTGKIIESETPIVSDGVTSYYQKDDVLFGKLRPYLAKVVLAKSEGVCTGELLVLNPKNEKVNPAFLAYRLRADDFIKAVDNSTYGSKMPRANWNFIGNQKINLPPLIEQTAAAKKLDTDSESVTKLIEQKRLLIEKLKEQRASIIHHAVTRGLDDNTELVENGVEWIGKIPVGWKVMRFKFVGEAIIGLTYSPEEVVNDGGILVLRASNIQDNKIAFADNVFVNARIPNKLKTRQGDVLICSRNGSRNLIGKSILIDKNTEGMTFGAFMTVFRGGNGRYISKFLMSDIFTSQLNNTLTTTINQLTTGNLNDMLIICPPANQQEEIGNYLEKTIGAIDLAIRKVQESIELVKEYRTAIIGQTLMVKV